MFCEMNYSPNRIVWLEYIFTYLFASASAPIVIFIALPS